MKVRIADPLLAYTRQQRFVEASGATLDALLLDLDRQYPGIRFRIVDEQDEMRPHIVFFIDGTKSHRLDDSLQGCREVVILQALSGG